MKKLLFIIFISAQQANCSKTGLYILGCATGVSATIYTQAVIEKGVDWILTSDSDFAKSIRNNPDLLKTIRSIIHMRTEANKQRTETYANIEDRIKTILEAGKEKEEDSKESKNS